MENGLPQSIELQDLNNEDIEIQHPPTRRLSYLARVLTNVRDTFTPGAANTDLLMVDRTLGADPGRGHQALHPQIHAGLGRRLGV